MAVALFLELHSSGDAAHQGVVHRSGMLIWALFKFDSSVFVNFPLLNVFRCVYHMLENMSVNIKNTRCFHVFPVYDLCISLSEVNLIWMICG